MTVQPTDSRFRWRGHPGAGLAGECLLGDGEPAVITPAMERMKLEMMKANKIKVPATKAPAP